MQVGLGLAKGKDSAITLGPWLVTAEELEPYRRGEDSISSLRCSGTARIGSDRLASMAWSFEDLVAYASRGTWVTPATCSGRGRAAAAAWRRTRTRAGRREPPPLTPGDVVTMNVEGIGTISNRIVVGTEPRPVPRSDTCHLEVG